MRLKEKYLKLKYLLSDESLFLLPEYQQRVKVSDVMLIHRRLNISLVSYFHNSSFYFCFYVYLVCETRFSSDSVRNFFKYKINIAYS